MSYKLQDLMEMPEIIKIASSPMEPSLDEGGPSLFKLAQLCREAAVEPDGEPDSSLVEKRASVAVLGQVMMEIDGEIGQPLVKAASKVNVDAFVDQALVNGYKPEDIAGLLKQAGTLGEYVSRARNTLNAEPPEGMRKSPDLSPQVESSRHPIKKPQKSGNIIVG